MRRIDQSELRFLILRGLQMLSRSVLKEMQSGSYATRQQALERATEVMHERLSHLEYDAPDPLQPHGD